MTGGFKDHFSRDSSAYAAWRPRYPAALFEWLASVVPGHALAWDAGTGNGQAAVALAAHFERVVASDPSASQLANAMPHPRVEYREAGESAGLDAGSADLVTVAQALHWFDRDRFWQEARRVLRPGGVVAVWCYELQRITPEVDQVVGHFYHVTVGEYWTPERRLVEHGYRTVDFPFEELLPPPFAMTAEWSLEQELGYLGTWSAVNRMRDRTGRDPVSELRPALEAAWPADRLLRVEWPLSVRAGRAARRA